MRINRRKLGSLAKGWNVSEKTFVTLDSGFLAIFILHSGNSGDQRIISHVPYKEVTEIDLDREDEEGANQSVKIMGWTLYEADESAS